MKKFCLLLALCPLCLIGTSQAFWTNTNNLEKTNQVIRVDHRNGQAEVTITETIGNNSGEAQTYSYLMPVAKSTSSINLYRDGTGLSYTPEQGPTLLKRLWEYDQRDLLQLGQYHDQKVLVSIPITVQPGEATEIKLKYLTSPETINGVSILKIDLSDRLLTQNFETSFNLVGSNRHFLPPSHLVGGQLTEGSTTTWLHQSSNYQSNKPLTFIWSDQATPTLSYHYQDYDYHLQLEVAPGPTNWETVTILVDQSGSMFGERWEHSQTLLKEFLKKLSPSTKFRVGFFDNKVSWFHEVPVPNSAEEQKRFFDWWDTQIPTGRTDWALLQEVLKDLQLEQSANSKSAGLIIGDFSKFEIDEKDHYNLKSFRRSLLLDFTENELVSFWSRLNDGQYQTIFSQDEDLIQWPQIWQNWQHLHLAKTPPSNTVGRDPLPAEINFFPTDRSLLWLSRHLPSGNQVSTTADFIPHWWAERRAASDLRRMAITNLEDSKKLALHAIIRVLGVSTNTIDPTLGKSDLFSAIESLPMSELWSLIWELESQVSRSPRLFWQNGKPLFQLTNEIWTSADFDQDFGLKSGLKIKAGSAAEQQLFYFFPDLLSTALSLGTDINFCGNRRCVQISDNGETEAKQTHKLDWRARLKPHWANSFAIELADQNTVKIDPFGDLTLDQPVTRGEFIRWLVEWYFGPDFTERTAGISDPRFSDVTDESTAEAQAIYLLRRKGVIQGYEDGTVRPNRPLARAEAVKIILALDGYKPKTNIPTENLPFRDISGWETPWVLRAKETGLVQGYGDGTFKPFQSLTRGEGMKLVVSFD